MTNKPHYFIIITSLNFTFVSRNIRVHTLVALGRGSLMPHSGGITSKCGKIIKESSIFSSKKTT